MKRRAFVVSSAFGSLGLWRNRLLTRTSEENASGTASARLATRKILIAGGNFNTTFVRYMATLTGKKRPKLLYLPTASADSQAGTIAWFKSCAPLDVEPSVQDSFIASTSQDRSWEDVLLSVDGIVASGGNTLNQQADLESPRHRQRRPPQSVGIKASSSGGASAGGLCWFEEGTTDSRPKELSTVYCLGFLKGSHCPHYDKEPGRRPLYHKLIGSGQMKPGYACDNDAGIYFEDNEVKRVVSARPGAKVYYVTRSGNDATEKVMEPEMIS